MKKLKRIILSSLLLVLVFILVGCGAKIDNKITIDKDGAGIREIICTVSEDNINDAVEGGEEALDKVIKENKPDELEMKKSKQDGNIQYTFSYKFNNINKFKEITEKLAGRPIEASITTTGNVFNKNINFYTEQALEDIIKWAPQAVVDAGLTTYGVDEIYEIGNTEVIFDNSPADVFYGDIDTNIEFKYAIENVDIITTFKNEKNIKREVIFSIPESTENELNKNNNELDAFFQTVISDKGNVEKTNTDGIVRYNINFECESQEQLNDITNYLTDSSENHFIFYKLEDSSFIKPSYFIEDYIDFTNLLSDIDINNPITSRYILNKKYNLDYVYDFEMPKEIKEETIISDDIKLLSNHEVEVMNSHEYGYSLFFNSKFHSQNYIVLALLIILVLITIIVLSVFIYKYLRKLKIDYNNKNDYKNFTFEYKALALNIKNSISNIKIDTIKTKAKEFKENINKENINKDNIKKYLQSNSTIIKGSLISLAFITVISIILVGIINKALANSLGSTDLLSVLAMGDFIDFTQLKFWEIALLSFTGTVRILVKLGSSGGSQAIKLFLYIPVLILVLIPFVGLLLGSKIVLNKNNELNEKDKFKYTVKIALTNALVITLISIFLFKSYSVTQMFFEELNIKSSIRFTFLSVLIGTLFWQLLASVIINYKAIRIYLNEWNYGLYFSGVIKTIRNGVVILALGLVVLSCILQVTSTNKPWTKDKAALNILASPNIISHSLVISSGGVLDIGSNSDQLGSSFLNQFEDNMQQTSDEKTSYNIFANIKSNSWVVYLGFLMVLLSIASGFLSVITNKKTIDFRDITVFSLLYSLSTCVIAFVNRITFKIKASSQIVESLGVGSGMNINISYNLFLTFIICFVLTFAVSFIVNKIFKIIKPVNDTTDIISVTREEQL